MSQDYLYIRNAKNTAYRQYFRVSRYAALQRRGSAFLNEYARKDPTTGERNDGGPSNPNHLLGTFPTLFPYGKGGFETKRPVNVPYEAHARWALRYHDRRFRKDLHFPFQVFGVCQKRQVCHSVKLQIRKSDFIRDMELITTLKPEDLVKASVEERRKVRFSNPAVRLLRKKLHAVRSHIRGSDESRLEVRSKIWGMTLAFNPASLWVTINPADTQDPIAQVLAGVDIDLDNFCKTLGPTSTERATNIAGDPFASAEFFHLIIKTVIEILFGVEKSPSGLLKTKEGIFGHVQGYLGTVEAQGRGTLHLHMLIWLKGAPTSQDMQQLLRGQEFRDRIRAYIKAVVRADIDELGTDDIMRLDPVPSISYSRPLDPLIEDEGTQKNFEKCLARTLQVHICSTNSCLRHIRGRFSCKRRAPFTTSAEEWVEESGEWGPKRTSSVINSWNPPIIRCVRANNDIKIMTNGRLTAKIAFYLTSYTGKKQTNSSNVTALLAKDLAFHRKLEKKQTDLKAMNKRLIQRCANSLTKHREFSAPEVISYIMGWGDCYESHFFVPVYLDAIVRALKQEYPSLTDGRTTLAEGSISEGTSTVYFSEASAHLKDQLRDYRYRGVGLSSMNLLDFILNTYEGKETTETERGTKRKRNGQKLLGRPPNDRHRYLSCANKGNLCRIIRTAGNEVVPRICGAWFARRDREREVNLHRATMLALLVPWRLLGDLKPPGKSFYGRYLQMWDSLDERGRAFIQNAQFYHESLDKSKEKEAESSDTTGDFLDEVMEKEIQLEREQGEQDLGEITEEDIEVARIMRTKTKERLYGEAAIDTAMDHDIFSETLSDRTAENIAEVATSLKMDQIAIWEKGLQEYNRRTANIQQVAATEDRPMASTCEEIPREIAPTVFPSDSPLGINATNDKRVTCSEPVTRPRPLATQLNTAQRRAHDIVEQKLKEHLNGKTEQLRMLVLGAGGTGKSLLIGAITETFRFYDQEHILAKCATTGIAAANIGAQTLHSWAALPIARPRDDEWVDKGSKQNQRKRRKNIEGKIFLIEDEVSMEDKRLLYDSSLAVSKIKGGEGWGSSAYKPYGGMHVIKFGDFHQFPPVKNPTGALYVDRDEDDRKAQIGREIFLQFNKVVILEEQMRVTDATWTEILQKIRIGQCSRKDVEEVQKLVLGHEDCDVPDFGVEPWCDAILVTPRHAVRELWNEYSVKKHCSRSRNRMYTVTAEDFEKDSGHDLSMEAKLAIGGMKDKYTGNLQDKIYLAEGMKAMVKINYAVEADIANGTRGRIEKIILDERDKNPTSDEYGDVILRYPPALVLFRPDKPSEVTFDGMEPGLIPITPSSTSFTARRGCNRYKIIRRQYAITPGYAFTDYKSQGQTIEFVLIDIGRTHSGSPVTPFGLYVALSRSRGRKNIRLLRKFDETLFQNHPSEHLQKDMERLERLNLETKACWERTVCTDAT